MATTYLSRTQSSGTSDKIGTFSSWIKLSSFSEAVFSGHTDSNNRIALYFSDTLRIYGAIGGSQSVYLITNQVFRDPSAWYHIVIAWDTTQGTDSNRFKVYVNGSQVTSFSTASYPTQNADVYWNKGTTSIVGARFVTSITNYFNGSMSHVHFIDGTAYDASAFGQADANGVWKIKTSPSVTYGTNGFFILKDGNSVTDQSGNGNNFTVGGGTLTNTEDNPSNVFATLNPNYQSTFHSTSRAILANGNTKWTGTSDSTSQNGILSTLGASTGKWYLEVKWKGTYDCILGVAKEDFGMMTAGTGGFQSEGWYGMITNIGSGMIWHSNNSATGDTGSALSSNDIIMMAIDLDNSKLYFGKNGTWEESGDPTSGATGTGATSTLASNTTYLVGCSNYGYSTANSWEFNFGNGYFGSTAVASAGTNASGNGIFEYDVPTGYTALCTKGLNGE